MTFCFHDTAGWDNNNGNNWTYKITKLGSQKSG